MIAAKIEEVEHCFKNYILYQCLVRIFFFIYTGVRFKSIIRIWSEEVNKFGMMQVNKVNTLK